MRLKINLFEEYQYLDISKANMLFSAVKDMEFNAKSFVQVISRKKKNRLWEISYWMESRKIYENAVCINKWLEKHELKTMFDIGSSPDETDMIALIQRVLYLLECPGEVKEPEPATDFEDFLKTLPQGLQDVLRPELVLTAKYMKLLELLQYEDPNIDEETLKSVSCPQIKGDDKMIAFYINRVECYFERVNEILKQNGLSVLFQI